MRASPARERALKVLGRIRRDAAFSGAVLDADLRASNLSPPDAALATRLVYGVLSTQGVLDEVIARFSHRSVEPKVMDVLRLAAYELLYGRAPAYAVVDEAVRAVEGVRPQAKGLVNAVARRIAEAASDFPWGDPACDTDALARLCGCPRWIVDEHLASLGPEIGRVAVMSCAEPAPTYVRLNDFVQAPSATLRSLSDASPRPAEPDPLSYELRQPAAAFRKGISSAWFAMDAAAQMAPSACSPRPGLRILDACAGRGNKTICLQSIAARHGGPADIVALELHPGKAERLRERLSSSRVPLVDVVSGDLREALALFGPSSFDVVLLDAPCTGLGTLRRYPEKRWRLQPGEVKRMAALQAQLLEAASTVVRPGGSVVYSTCSISRAENDAVVASFLTGPEGHRYKLESLTGIVPDSWSAFLTKDGAFQSWATIGGPDGHYVAVLRRVRE